MRRAFPRHPMSLSSIHPAVRVMAWSAIVLGLQWLTMAPLALAAVLAATLALVVARPRVLRLFHRTRWVFFALILVFAVGTPGVLVLPGLGPLGPTYDGLGAAAEHAIRLAAIVALVAVLLETTPAVELVAGLYGLMAPLRALGLDTRRAVVRLMLVMEYVDRAPPSDWRDWMLADVRRPDDAGERYSLPRHEFGWPDALVLAGLLGLALACL